MDLTAYKGVDPDTLYHNADNKITFFYVPDEDELLYDDEGYNTHQDMLQKDDDGDDMVFDMVFSQYADWPDYKKRPLRSRKQALKHTNCILGRLAHYQNDLIVAVWNPLSDPNINKFKAKLLQTFPHLKKQAVVLVGKDQKPTLLNAAAKPVAQGPRKGIGFDRNAAAEANIKKFNIGGKSYSLSDMHHLRVSIHTKSMPLDVVQGVLCHPDMDNYPELRGYRIKCPTDKMPERVPTNRERWRTAAREIDPYMFKYGESFADFFFKCDRRLVSRRP